MNTQSNKELLELAAKVAGIELMDDAVRTAHGWAKWNPLTDDGDALRLAVKCGMGVRLDVYTDSVCITHFDIDLIEEKTEDDPLAATRRAIVRAAAAIAKAAGEAA
jgi:hypothetical protein